MMTGPISTLHHPTLIEQTDRDPRQSRDEEAARRRQAAQHGHPHHQQAPTDEPPAAGDEHKTIGLLLDVKA